MRPSVEPSQWGKSFKNWSVGSLGGFLSCSWMGVREARFLEIPPAPGAREPSAFSIELTRLAASGAGHLSSAGSLFLIRHIRPVRRYHAQSAVTIGDAGIKTPGVLHSRAGCSRFSNAGCCALPSPSLRTRSECLGKSVYRKPLYISSTSDPINAIRDFVVRGSGALRT